MTLLHALAAFALIPLAMAAHVLAAQHFGWFRKWPIIELAVMGLGAIILLWMLLNVRPLGFGLIALNLAAWILVGFFFWWTQVYSAYPAIDAPISIGEDAKDRLSIDGLIDDKGQPVDLPALLDRSEATLLVFYRGHW